MDRDSPAMRCNTEHACARAKLNRAGEKESERDRDKNTEYRRLTGGIKTTSLKDGKRRWFNRWNVMET